MPQQKINLNPKGLYTNVNQLGAVPPGALSETTNVAISKPGVLSCRRGEEIIKFFASKQNGAWTPTASALRSFNANLRIGGSRSNNYLGTRTPGIIVMLSNGTMMWMYDDAGTFKYEQVNPTYGQSVISMPPLERDRAYYAFEQNGAFFINTGNGIVTVTRPTPNIPIANLYAAPTAEEIADWSKAGYSRAGVPWGIDTRAELYTGGANTAIDPDSQVAYRFCFGYRDANNVLHLGAPSSRVTVTNPAAKTAADARVSTVIPPGIIPSRHFWQLYRTLASSSETTDPGDDEGLVAEGAVPATSNATNVTRTGATATLVTASPHGLISPVPTTKQTLRLESDIVGTAAAVFDNFYIERMGTPSGGTGTYRVWTRTSAGVVTQGAQFTLPCDAQLGTNVLFFSDSTNGKAYFIDAGCSAIQTFTYTGALSTQIALRDGVKADLGCYDRGTRTIHLYCRPAVSAWDTFDYEISNGWYLTIDSGGLQALNATEPIISVTDDLLAYKFATVCKLGIFRASSTSQTYSCLAIVGTSVGWLIHSTAKFSSAGSYLSYQSALGGASAALSYTNVTAATTELIDKNTTNTRFFFGYQTQQRNASNVHLAQEAKLCEVIDNGLGVPTLRWSAYVLANASDLSFVPKIDAIKMNEVSGKMFAIARFRNVGAARDEWDALTWIATPSSIADTPVSAILYSAVVWSINEHYPPNSFIAQLDSVSMLINLQPSDDGSTNTNELRSVSGTSGGLTTLTDLPNGLYHGTVGPSASIVPVIVAGTYEVQSVPSTTSFTITSAQITPDIPSTPINALFNHMEIVHIDTVGPSFIGPYIYTAPAVEGIAQSNYPPPACRDIALFRTTAFYANTKQTPLVSVTLLKTTTAEYGNRVYLGGAGAYVTAGATESISGLTYKVWTTLASPSLNAKATIESLARVVNCNWNRFKTLIYPVGVGISQFANFGVGAIDTINPVQFEHKTAAGALIVGTYTPNSIYSEATENRNFLYYSKSNIPDAIPLGNYLRIGSDAKAILRVLASRDALFVFKEDGCYIVRGYGPPWQVDPYDLTLSLSIRDSLCTLDNAVFGAFTRGIFKVSDSNVELLSLPVQNLLEPYLSGSQNEQAQIESFGIGDNADHKYLLWLPTPNSRTDIPRTVFVFDTFTSEWSTWDAESLFTVMYQDRKMLHSVEEDCECIDAGNQSTGYFPGLAFERKLLEGSDFADGVVFRWPDASDPVSVRSQLVGYDSVAKTVTFQTVTTSNLMPVKKYDVIVPFDQDQTYVDAIMVAEDKADGSLVVKIENNSVAWLSGLPTPVAVKVYRSIRHGWKFAQTFPETPAATNHFSELAVSFREVFWSALTASFEVPSEQMDKYPGPQLVNFKGVEHFGPKRSTSKNNFIRTYVPRQAQRGTMITCGIETGACGKPIESNGMTVILTQGPTSFQRR